MVDVVDDGKPIVQGEADVSNDNGVANGFVYTHFFPEVSEEVAECRMELRHCGAEARIERGCRWRCRC